MSRVTTVDLALVGGGLANGLIAWRLAMCRPDIRFVVLEATDRLGGNHTWSFHDDDISEAQRWWMLDLVVRRWEGYRVRFPKLLRSFDSGYNSVSSERFHERIAPTLGDRVRFGAAVAKVGPTTVRLASGETIHAAAVIDGRGPQRSRHMALGYQKFVGQDVQLDQPHGLERPLVMDADVSQEMGYRFVYVLPFAPDRLLIEDTYYADERTLDEGLLRTRIAAYAAREGWRVRRVLREEQGVLPIVLAGDITAFWDEAGGVPRSGLAAGLFHPTTGYSLPDAVRLADLILRLDDLAAPALFAAVRAHAEAQWHARAFYRQLNRMLFLAGEPCKRYAVMRRFYSLPEPLIRRFYSGATSAVDKMRILTGKPPVPLISALKAIAASDLHRRAP